MAIIKCKECGRDVSDMAKSCPNCGCPVSDGRIEDMEIKEEKNNSPEEPKWIQTNTKVNWENERLKKKNKKKGIIAAIAILFIVGAISSMLDSGNDKEAIKTDTGSQINEQTADSNKTSKKESDKSKEWEEKYKDKDIKYVDLDFLYKNAKYYKDNIVMCCGNAYKVGEKEVQFDTDDGNFFIEITCAFEEDVSDTTEGQGICFVGKVGDTTSLLGTDTVKINNCYVVAKDDNVSKYQKMVKKNKKKQKKYVSDMKKQEKKKEENKSKRNKDGYIKKCKSYKYKDIQRNPDNYKEKNIKISGIVIQSTEGWFNGVTLRVEDSNGDVWYVNYKYSEKENKILENDKLTIYGECTGTETYVTVLGSSVTIPSIDAEYIE